MAVFIKIHRLDIFFIKLGFFQSILYHGKKNIGPKTQKIYSKFERFCNCRISGQVFCKKGVLRNFAKFTGKHLCQSLFFNKVAGLRLYLFLYLHYFNIIFTGLLFLPDLISINYTVISLFTKLISFAWSDFRKVEITIIFESSSTSSIVFLFYHVSFIILEHPPICEKLKNYISHYRKKYIIYNKYT